MDPQAEGWYARIDESPDAEFYRESRMVQHIDDGAIAQVTEIIAENVAPGSVVLDLMSSWVSHLPEPTDLPLARVAGLGMNAAELAANPRLDDWVVVDLNGTAAAGIPLPYPDQTFDAVLNTVSFQYLTDPVATLREVARVMKPGGVLIITFSDRMFPTKATRIWQETAPEMRSGLIAHLLSNTGAFRPARFVDARQGPRGMFGGPDPLWGVIARRR